MSLLGCRGRGLARRAIFLSRQLLSPSISKETMRGTAVMRDLAAVCAIERRADASVTVESAETRATTSRTPARKAGSRELPVRLWTRTCSLAACLNLSASTLSARPAAHAGALRVEFASANGVTDDHGHEHERDPTKDGGPAMGRAPVAGARSKVARLHDSPLRRCCGTAVHACHRATRTVRVHRSGDLI